MSGEALPPEIFLGEIQGLNHRPPRSVEDEDPPLKLSVQSSLCHGHPASRAR